MQAQVEATETQHLMCAAAAQWAAEREELADEPARREALEQVQMEVEERETQGQWAAEEAAAERAAVAAAMVGAARGGCRAQGGGHEGAQRDHGDVHGELQPGPRGRPQI